MIIVRSPLRITLGGGGTDLPSYYRDHEGFLIAAAIDKYVYVTILKAFTSDFIIRYSANELVSSVDAIRHPIVREACKLAGVHGGVEIVSTAEVPSGAGLGSSGSFTTALLRALHAHQRQIVGLDGLAAEACRIEIDLLNEPIGKQDQYIAAYGGVTCFEFHRDDTVGVQPLRIADEDLTGFEESLSLFYTGGPRAASSILREQDQRTKTMDAAMIRNLHAVKELGLRSKAALEAGRFEEFGAILDEHWRYKKQRSDRMSNERIDQLYELALRNGATGGKLVGAGGGGFLMFHTLDKPKLRRAMLGSGASELRFRFDFEGTKLVSR